MSFELLCMGLIALTFGLAVVFSGYRLFLFLLPFWGFFVGFYLGAQAIQALFDEAFLATVTSWGVGFVVGAIFAVLSYLFYFLAVGIISFSLGYAATVGILEWIGMDFGFLLWIIAVVIGVAVALAVYYFNLQKIAIIVITAFGGTSLIIYTIMAMTDPAFRLAADFVDNPVALVIDNSFWWLLFFIVVAGSGIFLQIQANRSFEIDEYNRWAEYSEAVYSSYTVIQLMM